MNALTLATSAWLEMRAIVATAGPARSLTTQLDGQLAMAQRAVALAPDSSIAHEHLGTVNNWRGHFEEAARDFERSLELNPLNTDARAGYGIMLGRSSQWLLANQQASIAITDTPYAPAWYYFPVTIYDFRERRFADALETARDTMQFGGGELGAIMAVAAAQELGREDVVEELQPRLMAMESLRRSGIIPWFSLQIADQKLIAAVALDLERAGVPNAALTAPF